jgi:cytidine deaminase
MQEVILQIKYTEHDTTVNLPEGDIQLIIRARKVAQHAYAPYSGYRVGAAVLLGNGIIITGNNQENAAYPSGLCAERTALFYAASQYPDIPIVAIAVSTLNHSTTRSGSAKPCGACRQVMAEYEDLAGKPLHILLDSSEKVLVLDGIDNLLPLRFRKEDLKQRV